MTKSSNIQRFSESESVDERQVASLILTLLSVADDDKTLSQSLSMLAAQTSEDAFSCGMQEAARRIGVLLGTAEQLKATRRFSANGMPA